MVGAFVRGCRATPRLLASTRRGCLRQTQWKHTGRVDMGIGVHSAPDAVRIHEIKIVEEVDLSITIEIGGTIQDAKGDGTRGDGAAGIGHNDIKDIEILRESGRIDREIRRRGAGERRGIDNV